MTQTTYQVDLTKATTFLHETVAPKLSSAGKTWLEETLNKLQHDFSNRQLYLAFSLVPRKVGKERLPLSVEQLQAANALKEGFQPVNLTVDQAVRILFTLVIPNEDKDAYLKRLKTLFSTGEVYELVALYTGLPLYPYPEYLKERASEGVRTNMTVVFDAIALNNPYPAEYMEEGAWNQMVLKAVFMERPLDKIYGLDKRANENLAIMLTDYAHERWAAKRYVTPELWRPVGPFINESSIKDMERLFKEGTGLEQEAAALACASSSADQAKQLLNKHPDFKSGMEKNEINWKTVSVKWQEQ